MGGEGEHNLFIAHISHQYLKSDDRDLPVKMPGMDGLEAMCYIRDRRQTQVPIIALTALAMSGDRGKCIEAGANEYLTKPIKFKQLTATIQ